MAWLSVGTSNDDLCDKMVMNGVLEEGKLLNAFRVVDRGDFVPPEDRLQAYHDRPFKKDSIHISAPHMYVTVLEALDLKPGNAFLNVGSGSGYLCCLAWCLLGEHGLSHGIEINPRTVEFSRASIDRFHRKRRDMLGGKFECDPVTIVEGNCFNIDVHNSMMQCKYDRIYVGAGCPEARKQFFYDLLADGGVLVVPIDERNQMIKVTKITGNIFSVKHISNVHFAPLIDLDDEDDLPPAVPVLPLTASHATSALEDQIMNASSESLFVFQRSSDYSARSHHPSRVQLPTSIWAPVKTRHRQYPFEFRQMVKFILMASNQCDYSRVGPMRSFPKCLCSLLPTPIWYQILSYANRDWFVPQKSEVDMLRLELMTERRLRRQTEEKLQIAEQARRIAERERDLFRAVMTRLGPRSKYYPLNPHHLDLDDEEDDDEGIDEEDDDGDGEEDHSEEEEEINEEAEMSSVADGEMHHHMDHDSDDENDDQTFQDTVDIPTTVEMASVDTTSTAMDLSPSVATRHSFPPTDQYQTEASTSFGSNTTGESMMAEDMEEASISEEREDRSSFDSTYSRESSVDNDDIRLSFSGGVDAEEHFASDL